MLPEPFTDALVLTGPTGCGKTRIALEVVPRLNAEIIAMDSMTLYRGMDIGTAKPTVAERSMVAHHLVDVLEPWESASVAWWLERAAHSCRAIRARGKRPCFVGGTPLYLKALLCGLFEGPPADTQLRQRLLKEAGAAGSQALHRQLAVVDPQSAARLHPNDLRRIVRALEVWQLTGRPISAWQTQWNVGPTPAPDLAIGRESDLGPWSASSCLWIDLPREQLYDRINRRVECMAGDGWLEEARRLTELAMPLSAQARQALGYQEMFDCLAGRITLAAAIANVQKRTRNFAKRQQTWFRHLPECQPLRKELTIGTWQLTIA